MLCRAAHAHLLKSVHKLRLGGDLRVVIDSGCVSVFGNLCDEAPPTLLPVTAFVNYGKVGFLFLTFHL